MRFRQVILASAMALALASPAAHAATVFSDNFDSNPLKLDTAPAGWVLTTEGKVNLIGSGVQSDPANPILIDPLPGNGVYVDLIGTSGITATLVSPTFSLTAGVDYAARFALAGNQSGGIESVQVNFGDSEQTYVLPAFTGFTTFTIAFTPTSTADYAISFQTVGFTDSITGIGPGSGDRGALLDNLSVSTAVPEPASYALLLAGLIGLHVVARRRIQP